MRKLYLIGFLLLTCFGAAEAQVSSSAFDRNCYQPLMGTPGEVDTIYGSRGEQFLGNRIKTMWRTPGKPNGRVLFESDTMAKFYPHQIPTYAMFEPGPDFDLHHLQIVDTFNIGWQTYFNDPDYIFKRGHFRSTKYLDLLMNGGGTSLPPRIYWADSQGEYDSTRFTELRTSLLAKHDVEYNKVTLYSTHLFSDTIDDIVCGVTLHDTSVINDSVYLLYFKGGMDLYLQGKKAVQDSSQYLGILQNRYCSQGGYRGVGREDLIASTESEGNVFFYKNDPPFSFQKLANALKYDTLMANWEPPNGGKYFGSNQFSMKAFTKAPGDSSVDFMPSDVNEVFIYKGGPDFGSHRLYANTADFTFHCPSYYDFQWNGLGFGGAYNCGDMTGTGNPVVMIPGFMDGGFYSYYFFYVLGDAMDDKVDMFLSSDNRALFGGLDTLVADGDKLQDVILGMPGYYSDADLALNKTSVGSITVIHGSKNIPVPINSVSSRKSVDESPSHIHAYPNPCDEKTVLTFDNCDASNMHIQVIASNGESVLQEETPIVNGLQQYALSLSSLAAGSYTIALSCPANGWSTTTNIIKTGPAQTLWNLDLQKMVGR